jgi:hypothetical protein
VLLALPLAGGAALPDAHVLFDQGRISIHSQQAPLTEILSRFAQATGAEVVYEGARPRQLVSVAIEAASPAGALAQLLEGQGLDYVLRLDPSGRNVEMLVVSGSAAPAAASAATRSPRPPAPPPAEESFEAPPDAFPFTADAAEGLEPTAAAGDAGDGEALSPDPSIPFVGSTPGAPFGAEPSNQEAPPEPSALEPSPPQTPAPASYPGEGPLGPSVPSPPAHPGPASYPGGI